MKKQIQKVRDHFRENKTLYITGGVCLIAGVAGGALAFRKNALVDNKITQVLSYKPEAKLEVFIEALGDPGNIVQDTTTGSIYASQGQAARELGVSPIHISQHLNGKREHVNGHTFTKLGKAAVA
jgi:hypothetical protein